MKRHLIIATLITILAAWISSGMAAEGTWVTVEGSYPLAGLTSEQAFARAEKEALRKAVEQVVGSQVKSEGLIIDSATIKDMIQTESSGRVLQHEIIEDDIQSVSISKGTREHIAWVKIKAQVVEEKEELDPYFRIKVDLNRTSFKNEDEVTITVTSQSKVDSYLYLFIIMSDTKVLQLLPNQYKKDSLLKAGETFIYPDTCDKDMGLELVACLPGDVSQVSETLYALALKQAYDFGQNFAEGVYSIYDGQTALADELVKVIANIPIKDRTLEFIHYEIKNQ